MIEYDHSSGRDAPMAITDYVVTGMTCSHCEKAVREEVALIPGVTDVQVSAPDGALRLTSETAVDDADVVAAVDEAGYVATRA